MLILPNPLPVAFIYRSLVRLSFILATDSHTPLLVKRKRPVSDASEDTPASKEVSDAAKAFSKLKNKPKTGLWGLAAKANQSQQSDVQQEQQQQQQQQPHQQQHSPSSVESPVPLIKVSEPSFDKNANASHVDDKSKKTSLNGKSLKSQHFSDVVMSSFPSQVLTDQRLRYVA